MRPRTAACCRSRTQPPLPACSPALLPQLLQQVLGYCGARELGALETTCSYFIKSGLTDRVAKHFLRDIPRAKGLKPENRWVDGCWQSLLQCVRSRALGKGLTQPRRAAAHCDGMPAPIPAPNHPP